MLETVYTLTGPFLANGFEIAYFYPKSLSGVLPFGAIS